MTESFDKFCKLYTIVASGVLLVAGLAMGAKRCSLDQEQENIIRMFNNPSQEERRYREEGNYQREQNISEINPEDSPGESRYEYEGIFKKKRR